MYNSACRPGYYNDNIGHFKMLFNMQIVQNMAHLNMDTVTTHVRIVQEGIYRVQIRTYCSLVVRRSMDVKERWTCSLLF